MGVGDTGGVRPEPSRRVEGAGVRFEETSDIVSGVVGERDDTEPSVAGVLWAASEELLGASVADGEGEREADASGEDTRAWPWG
jgi:hypothetical protein